MFKPEPAITHVPATREQVVALVESINQPQVSIPGKAPQAVSGLLAGVRNANNTLSLYVALHLPRAGENVVYVHERRQLSTVEEYREVQAEGVHFLESMGFMLDNLNYANLAPAAQQELLARIPFFSPPRPPAAAAAAAAAKPDAPDPARVARLLASF